MRWRFFAGSRDKIVRQDNKEQDKEKQASQATTDFNWKAKDPKNTHRNVYTLRLRVSRLLNAMDVTSLDIRTLNVELI